MRSYDSEDDSDREELERLKIEPWMLDQLKLNPSYTCWGPHEDYMWVKGDGWNSPILKEDWKSLGIDLDELNEVVNFYFSVGREHEECTTCGGSGYSPDAHWISESFYRHSSPFLVPSYDQRAMERLLEERVGIQRPKEIVGRGTYPPEQTLVQYGNGFRAFCEAMRAEDGHWDDKITDDEFVALSVHRKGLTCAEDVNRAQREHLGLGHDAINRGILIEARCKRLGVPLGCPACEGHGYQFTVECGHLTLTLWLIHPRKGASRGVEIKKIEQSDLPAVYAFLRQAATRNADRFATVVAVECQ